MTGWFSFLHGEATAGDVLALQAVQDALDAGGCPYDVAWSPVFRPDGLALDDADPARYTHLIFVCGPLHGPQIADLHKRFPDARRIAVGVSVLDPGDPAAAGFDEVLARDGHDLPQRDLAAVPDPPGVPVAGVVLALGQGEYGDRRRHDQVADRLTGWLGGLDCARLPLDTRLDGRDWRLPATAAQFSSIVRRLDVLVSTRLHGLVLGLRNGVPVLAVDPVAGGGKVTAQAKAWKWPAVLSAEDLLGPFAEERLARQLDWCLSAQGQFTAVQASGSATVNPLVDALLRTLSKQSLG